LAIALSVRFVATPLILLGVGFAAGPVSAQFAYEGVRQDIGYKVFIYDKQSLGSGRWVFQTKAVYSDGSKPYYSNRQVADCYKSTIDGKVVRAIAQYGYEEGDAAVLRAVCGRTH
jgi:hypothetical protein